MFKKNPTPTIKTTLLAISIGAIGWGITSIQVSTNEFELVKGVIELLAGVGLLLLREYIKRFDDPVGDKSSWRK